MSGVIDYEVFGDDMQYVEVTLRPKQSIVAEPGVMMYMEDNIRFDTRMGDGTAFDDSLLGRIGSGVRRLTTGESLFTLHYRNNSTGERKMGFAAPYPGKILPLPLRDVGGKLYCQRDSFLAMTHGATIELAPVGGESIFSKFILQKVMGDGLVFLHGGGTVTEKYLDGERLRLDASCIIAFESSLTYNAELVKDVKSVLFGKSNLIMLTLQGKGRIWFQSLPFSRLVGRIPEKTSPSQNGNNGNISIGAGDSQINLPIGDLLKPSRKVFKPPSPRPPRRKR